MELYKNLIAYDYSFSSIESSTVLDGPAFLLCYSYPLSTSNVTPSNTTPRVVAAVGGKGVPLRDQGTHLGSPQRHNSYYKCISPVWDNLSVALTIPRLSAPACIRSGLLTHKFNAITVMESTRTAFFSREVLHIPTELSTVAIIFF